MTGDGETVRNRYARHILHLQFCCYPKNSENEKWSKLVLNEKQGVRDKGVQKAFLSNDHFRHT